MPYVRIEITDGATTAQKLQLYKETTEMLVRILGKNPEYTFVVIEEVDNKNWGHKGTSVYEIRKEQAAAKAKAAPVKAVARKPVKLGAVPEKASLKRGPTRKA